MLAVATARLKKLAICGLTSLLASALIAPIQAEELPLTDAPAATAEYDSPIVNGDVDSFVFHDEAELAAYYQQGPATSSGRSTSSTPRSTASSAGQSRFGTAGSTYGQTAFSRPTYMIADNSGGGCGGLFIQGSLVASIMHPTFACSRLNIAESETIRALGWEKYKNGGDDPQLKSWAEANQGRVNDLLLDLQTLNAEIEGSE